MRRVSRGIAALSILVGVIVLLAWKFAILPIVTAGGDRKGMARGTAISLILIGISVFLSNQELRRSWTRSVRAAGAVLAIVLPAFTLLGIATGSGFFLDIDAWLGPLPAGATWPAIRMAPNTAFCLMLLGLSSLLINVRIGRLWPMQWGALLTGTVALAACIGYAYHIRALYGIGYTSMAVHTAATLLALSIALLFARPDVGLMAILSREGPVGTLVRRLFPAAIAAPIITGWICEFGEYRGWYGVGTGNVLAATLSVVFLLLFLYWAVSSRAAAEEKFRGLLESAPEAMVIVDQSGHIVLVNTQTERLFGYGREELFGKPVEMLMPECLREKHAGVRSQYLISPHARPMGAGLTLYGRRKQGSEFPVEVSLGPMHNDGGMLISSTIRDITERKQAEQALRESEERFRVALKNAPTVVFNQDRDLRYTWINSPVLAWAEKDFLGRTDAEIVGGEEGGSLTAIKRGVLESGVATRTETIVTFRGEPHYFDLTVEPLCDAHGDVVGITCASTDITPVKQGAEERERLIRELQDALAQVKVLSGLLPICASCKKIRDDHGEWNSVEKYIRERSSAQFTHGICPECARRLYPEYCKE